LSDAAKRELLEELGIETVSVGPVLFRRQDAGSIFEIIFVTVSVNGEPAALEHSEVCWLDRDRLIELPLAPADKAFVMESTVFTLP
jgi:8-oxo-dGTP pyrophosphatase MutT (NUDIX family)